MEKKNTPVEKERTLTSCDINRCLHFTETRFRSKVVVSWLPNIAEFFFSIARLIEDLERQLSSASYDSSEFLFRHFDEYRRAPVFCCNSFNACGSLRDRLCFGFVICISASCDLTSLVLLYSPRRRNKNSELSYEAELSCLSKSSISLAREEKNFAIFGSQQTTTLDRNLVSMK